MFCPSCMLSALLNLPAGIFIQKNNSHTTKPVCGSTETVRRLQKGKGQNLQYGKITQRMEQSTHKTWQVKQFLQFCCPRRFWSYFTRADSNRNQAGSQITGPKLVLKGKDRYVSFDIPYLDQGLIVDDAEVRWERTTKSGQVSVLLKQHLLLPLLWPDTILIHVPAQIMGIFIYLGLFSL